MLKKYIQNMTNSNLVIQDQKLSTVVKLAPYACSSRNFSQEFLEQLPHLEMLLALGKVTLQNQKTNIVLKNNAKNYGQKYKIGTNCFLNDDSKLNIVVKSYDPVNKLYTVSILKTGGTLKIKEKAISLTKPENKQINVGVGPDGELLEQVNTVDQSLPQKNEKVSISYSDNEEKQQAVSAADIIKSQDSISEQIQNQVTDIVYKDDEEVNNDNNQEELFVVKSDKDIFAKEISASEMTENVDKAIQDQLKVVSETVQSNKKQQEQLSEEEINNFVKLSEEMQDYIKSFMQKDSRSKKMVIARCKDVEKLKAISLCADDLSKKAALAKLGMSDANK